MTRGRRRSRAKRAAAAMVAPSVPGERAAVVFRDRLGHHHGPAGQLAHPAADAARDVGPDRHGGGGSVRSAGPGTRARRPSGGPAGPGSRTWGAGDGGAGHVGVPW